MIVNELGMFGLRGEAILAKPKECPACHSMHCFFRQTMKGWLCLDCAKPIHKVEP